MAIFSGDTLTTSEGGSATVSAATTDGVCVTPPNGKPAYNRVVLDTLHGEGRITVSEYNKVKAGLLSIVDLSITSDELARLRCDSMGESSYDPHYDRDLSPGISSIHATVNAAFESGTKPTDKSHRMTIETTSTALGAGDTICRVNFAREYEDEGGVVAPNVFVSVQDNPNATVAVKNVTSQHYDLVTVGGIAAGNTQTIAVTVEPVRR